jgi:hypothetical protein
MRRSLTAGRLVYEQRATMTRDVGTPVRAAVTLDETAPAREVLSGGRNPGSVAIAVSCDVEARLAADPAEFTISDTGWRSQSLATADTARWVWFVTPHRGGRHTLALDVRPIVRIQDLGGGQAEPITATTETFEVAVSVRVPPDETARKTLDRGRTLALAVSGFLAALTGVVAAAVGLRRVVSRRRTRG